MANPLGHERKPDAESRDPRKLVSTDLSHIIFEAEVESRYQSVSTGNYQELVRCSVFDLLLEGILQ